VRLALHKLTRQLNSERAKLAASLARPGEPHARCRARIVRIEREVNRRVERIMFFGDDA
jgi:hypothetical protein